MYRKKEETKQQEFVDFHLMFGGKLDPGNKWIRLAQIIPWEIYETQYAKLFSAVTRNTSKTISGSSWCFVDKNDQGDHR